MITAVDYDLLRKVGVNKCREYSRISNEFQEASSKITDAMIEIKRLCRTYPDVFEPIILSNLKKDLLHMFEEEIR
jgi:hypothetical protein